MNLRSLTALLMVMSCVAVTAQTTAPSTEQMIEQLKVPHTRSLRNLVIEATPVSGAASAPEPRPSLSLSVQFDFNSSRIRTESFEALSNLATALNSPALAQSKFLIEGHTDAKGASDYNQKLSEQRAQSVKELLTSKGVDVTHLVSVGKGSSDPANKADPLAAENRRVRIVNLD